MRDGVPEKRSSLPIVGIVNTGDGEDAPHLEAEFVDHEFAQVEVKV